MNKIILLVSDDIFISDGLKQDNPECLFLDANIEARDLYKIITNGNEYKCCIFVGQEDHYISPLMKMLNNKFYCKSQVVNQKCIDACKRVGFQSSDREIYFTEGILYAYMILK